MSVDIGIGTFSGQRPPDGSRTVADTYADLLAIARSAESSGFDSLWIASHHAHDSEHISAPLIVLSAVAAVTDRIGLGTAMALAPFQSPIRFAEDCATLDQLSRGRLSVGLGVGWRPEEFRQFSTSMADRGALTEDLARFCRVAWDQDVVTFTGRRHTFQGVRVTPRPYHRIPIVMGGTALTALKRAGRLADSFIATGTPHGGVGAFRAQVDVVDRAAAVAGRGIRIGVGFQANCWVSADGTLPDPVRDAMWSQIGTSAAAHAGTSERPPVDEDVIRGRGFIGTPGAVVDSLRPWLDVLRGRSAHLTLRLHYPGLAVELSQEAIALFAECVAPALRQICT